MSAALETNAASIDDRSPPTAVETTTKSGESSLFPVTMTAKPTSYKTTVVTFSAIAPYTAPAPVTAVVSAGNVASTHLPTLAIGTSGDAPTTYKVISPPAYLEADSATEGATEERLITEPITTTTMAYSAPAPVTYFTGGVVSNVAGEGMAVATTTGSPSQDQDLGYSAPAMTYKPVTYYPGSPSDPKSGEPSPVITYSAMPAQPPVSTTSAPTVASASAILPATPEPLAAAPNTQSTYKVAAPVFYSVPSGKPLPLEAVTSTVIAKNSATTTMGTIASVAAETSAMTASESSLAPEPKPVDTKQTVAKVMRRKMGCC